MGPDDRRGLELLCGCLGHFEELLESQHKTTMSLKMSGCLIPSFETSSMEIWRRLLIGRAVRARIRGLVYHVMVSISRIAYFDTALTSFGSKARHRYDRGN